MFIDKNSITINGISMGAYLVEAKYGFNKLWSGDSGRTLSGRMSASLIGIFPKLILQFRKLNRSEIEYITPILDSTNQTVRYYDPTKRDYVTMVTYTGDYEISNKRIITNNALAEGFSCSFISVSRRT